MGEAAEVRANQRVLGGEQPVHGRLAETGLSDQLIHPDLVDAAGVEQLRRGVEHDLLVLGSTSLDEPAALGAADGSVAAVTDHPQERPIGWWLKEVDARLDAAFDRRLEGRGVDRRAWQVLATLARQPARRSMLVASLAPFDSPAVIDGVVNELIARGWVEESAERLRLTSAGEGRQRELAALVDEVRQLVTAALPTEDYVTLIRLLQRLVDALPEASAVHG